MGVKKKTKRNRKRNRVSLKDRLKRVAIIAIKVVVVIASVPAVSYGGLKAYHELFTSPYLEIKRIEVLGVARASEEEVSRLADIELGQNILSIDLEEAAASIEGHPWIASAEMSRILPDSVEVVVTERRPLVLIRPISPESTGDVYVADTEGVLFKRYSPEDALDVPVVTGLSNDKDGGSLRLDEETLSLLAYLAKRKGFNIENISEINMDRAHGVTLYTLPRGVRVELGRGMIEEKLKKFEQIISSRGGTLKGVEAIDLAGERGVVLRLAKKAK